MKVKAKMKFGRKLIHLITSNRIVIPILTVVNGMFFFARKIFLSLVTFFFRNEAASDTEERVAKILEMQRKKRKENHNDIYSADTDEESPLQQISADFTNKFKNIFDDKKFYIDQSFDMGIYNKLLKYIVAYNG